MSQELYLRWLFILFLPLTLNSIFFVNLIVDGSSQVPRLLIWMVLFGVGILNFKAAVFLLLSILCLFEDLTIRLGYSNQFLIESGVLAVLMSAAVTKYKSVNSKQNDTAGFFLQIPTVIPVIFAVSFTVFSFINNISEIASFTPVELSVYRFLKNAISRALDWNVSDHNFFHPVSLMYGHLIFLNFIWILADQWRLIFKNKESMYQVILLGSLFVYAYSSLEVLGILTTDRKAGVSGAFQNPNHFSFYCGFILLVSIDYLKFNRHRFMTGLICFLSVCGIVLGRGKSTWIAITVCVFILLIVKLYILFFVQKICIRQYFSRKWILSKGLFFGSGVVGLAYLMFNRAEKFDVVREVIELSEIINDAWRIGIHKVFMSGGREDQLLFAIEKILENPWSGYGWGNFYAQSGMGYSLHFSYLTWLYNFGIAGLIAMTAGFILFLSGIFSSKKDAFIDNVSSNITLYTLFLYIFLCHFMDVYVDYRPVLYLISLFSLQILLATQMPVSMKFMNQKFGFRTIVCTVIVGAVIGGVSIGHPHTGQSYFKAYNKESGDFMGVRSFRWYAMATIRPIKTDQCWSTLVNTVPSQKSLPLVVSSVDAKDVSKPMSYQNLLSVERSSESSKMVNIWSSQWSELCICNDSGQNQTLLLRGKLSMIPGTVKGSKNTDSRMISFAFSDEKSFSKSERKNLFDRNGCDHLL